MFGLMSKKIRFSKLKMSSSHGIFRTNMKMNNQQKKRNNRLRYQLLHKIKNNNKRRSQRREVSLVLRLLRPQSEPKTKKPLCITGTITCSKKENWRSSSLKTFKEGLRFVRGTTITPTGLLFARKLLEMN